MIQRYQAWSIGPRTAINTALCVALLCAFVCTTAQTAPSPVEVLKEMPPKGSVAQGDVVYVDDGRCPAGEVKKITGGNQKTGVTRQVECVKRPRASVQP